MKSSKSKKTNTFSCFEDIISKYFPSEVKEKRNIPIDNPKLLGEHLAMQALKNIRLS
ncbi:MAG: hypothetical protein A4E71_02579 [Smithella sp. PtaU1.Bin162]|nr:MAG: hypothetical protein A4E71_02579 [Smithella sp. PtaU1.Bin162]